MRVQGRVNFLCLRREEACGKYLLVAWKQISVRNRSLLRLAEAEVGLEQL